jgi:oxygen-independent coproporphyrinogen-3 oxidase
VPHAELAALQLDPALIGRLVELGLLADDPARLRATAAGRLVLDALTAELLT